MRKNDASGVPGGALFKKSVTAVYETDAFSALLKDVVHPGGVTLTERVAGFAAPGRRSRVLDIACGKGVGCLLLAGRYGCRVVGIDRSEKKIAVARDRGRDEGLSPLTGFAVSDAETLPFPEGVFDVVISECSFSILPDKEEALRGIRRVLKPGGRFVMTDVFRKGSGYWKTPGGPRPEDLFPLVPCIAGAMPLEDYLRMFRRAGFTIDQVEDHSVEMKKLGYKMAIDFGGWDGFLEKLMSDLTAKTGGQGAGTPTGFSLEAYRDLFKQVKLGYALVVMTKPRTSGLPEEVGA